MKQKPSFQCYQQDFLGSMDFQTMTMEERGCYFTLILNCYNNGGKITANNEELSLLCHGSNINKKVLRKFYEKDGFLYNERIDIEIKKQEEWRQKCIKGGKKSAEARKELKGSTKGSCDLVASKAQLNSQGSTNSLSSSSSSSSSSSLILPSKENTCMCVLKFDKFWDAYPRKENKKKAKEKFMKLDIELFSIIMSSLEIQKKSDQWSDGFIPHAITWLNQERWDDEVTKKKEVYINPLLKPNKILT